MLRRLLLTLCCAADIAAAQTSSRRAILVSFDGLSEAPARMFTDSAATPALWSLFRTAACADGARPPFVSVTPSGHAAIWTGVYSNVNGIAAIANGALPLPSTTILESTDGYRAPQLSAEPIWISAARQGKQVFSHMATQSPGPPGYPVVTEPTAALDRVRANAAAANQRASLAAVNIYNESVSEARVITETTYPSHAASWRGLASLGLRGALTTREVSWAFGPDGDSLHALFVRSNGGVSRVVLAATRDVSRGVVARLAPTDTSRSAGRSLARHFSSPLRVNLARGRRTYVSARLFELAPDLSHYLLFVSEARVTQGNRAEVAQAYDDRVKGVPGNGAYQLLERGAFGTTIARGGDGTPELRYLETAELATRQFMRGAEASMQHYASDLLVDYLPYPDEALHMWYGLAHPSTPGVSPAVRAHATALLGRAYQLVDRKLRSLQQIARARPGTALFVAGEHGMRPSWMSFRPNVLLREAGIVVTDSSGAIDLSRTVAAATRGGWISVNRVTRKGGIVPVDSVDVVLARVEQVLRAARDSVGAPIIRELWRSTSPAADSLGLGGPAGGDLYYSLTPGYYPNAGAQGNVVNPMNAPRGEHGFASVDRDMWPVFCASGVASTPRRIGPVREIDIAPTVSEWLGITPPADARGRSLLETIRPR